MSIKSWQIEKKVFRKVLVCVKKWNVMNLHFQVSRASDRNQSKEI